MKVYAVVYEEWKEDEDCVYKDLNTFVIEEQDVE